MKYSPELYAKAFLEVLNQTGGKEERKIIKRFLAIVGKNGDLGRMEAILLEMEKILVRESGGKFVEVELARDEGGLLEKIRKSFSRKDHLVTRIRPELLAGTRILIDHEREFDFSFSGRLKKLFS